MRTTWSYAVMRCAVTVGRQARSTRVVLHRRGCDGRSRAGTAGDKGAGSSLAAFRGAAGLNQVTLAATVHYTRSTVGYTPVSETTVDRNAELTTCTVTLADAVHLAQRLPLSVTARALRLRTR